MGQESNGKRCAECGAVGVPRDEQLCKPCRLAEEEGPEARRLYLQDLARRGAKATHSKRSPGGLREEELPPLDGHEAAKAWLELLARKVAVGAVDRDLAAEVRRVVRTWMDAHKRETADEVVAEIREELTELRTRIQARDRPWE